jgi:hypothetical protein
MQAMNPGFSRSLLTSVRKHRMAVQRELFAVRSEQVWQHRFCDFNLDDGPADREALQSFVGSKSPEVCNGLRIAAPRSYVSAGEEGINFATSLVHQVRVRMCLNLGWDWRGLIAGSGYFWLR